MNPTEHIFYLEGNNTTKIGFRHLSSLGKSVKRNGAKIIYCIDISTLVIYMCQDNHKFHFWQVYQRFKK